MTKNEKYKIPDSFFFPIHHIRSRFKNDVEEVMLFIATSIAEIEKSEKSEFNSILNNLILSFKKNSTRKKKTIDNWRTEISAFFSLIREKEKGFLEPSVMAKRLANNQYLDEFFNYFLLTLQYPSGFQKPHLIRPQIKANIKFKPCQFILNLLVEGEKIIKKPFSVKAEELTFCAFYDLRVTTGKRTPKEVVKLILKNREENKDYTYEYEEFKGKNGKYRSQGDIRRIAGDILDYMVLANLLKHKGTNYFYYLNDKNKEGINYHLNNTVWFNGYDNFYRKEVLTNPEIALIEELWFSYVNSFENIDAFIPKLDSTEVEDISNLIKEYYSRMKGGRKFSTKIIGDYGESLILAHEYIRTKDKSKRQHLIQKIPTFLGVGYDIQSIEIEKKKRYIEVKTTKSRKRINNNRFKLTPNEWDTAETIKENYFIYYLVVNETGKNIFVIQDPVKQYSEGHLKVDKNLVIQFSKSSGQWQKLLEIKR